MQTCTVSAVQIPMDDNSFTHNSSVFTQITPKPNLSFANDQQVDIPISLWQTSANNFQFVQTHVHALLQHNFLLAQLLTRIEFDRFLTDYEQYVLQTSVSHEFWPNSFLSCSRTHELVTAILIWLHNQQ